MDNIKVRNGITIGHYEKYTLYEMYTDDATIYYMCLPNNSQKEYQMIIDFPEEYYKSLRDEEIKKEITKICDDLYSIKNDFIYLLPNITTYDLSVVKEENDNHAYQNLLKSLQKYTYSTYKSLSENDGIKISQTICIVTQTDDDKKLINWLDTELPGYFKSIDLSKLFQNKDNTNDESGWTTLGGPTNGSSSMEISQNMSKPKVKKLTTPNKHGFLNITFGITIIFLSLIIGIWLALTIIK